MPNIGSKPKGVNKDLNRMTKHRQHTSTCQAQAIVCMVVTVSLCMLAGCLLGDGAFVRGWRTLVGSRGCLHGEQQPVRPL